MHQYINSLGVEPFVKDKLIEIFKRNEELGFNKFSERILILKSALQYLGLTYLRTEELNINTIDCSTLTSQSYWEGAMIRIPFVAENQRVSNLGEQIKLENAEPGDLVIKYQNLNESPDKIYNHVGLLLGKDYNNTHYVIESNSKEGCVINTLKKFEPNGGYRKFVKNNIILNENTSTTLTNLAKKVPKLSRFWSKQYTKNDRNERFIHKGIDVYVPVGTIIKSPIQGFLTFGVLEHEFTPYLAVTDEKKDIKCVLGNVEPLDSINEKNEIKRGDYIGKIVKVSDNSKIDYSLYNGDTTHLHFEISGNIESKFELDKFEIDRTIYYNALYLAKLDLINLPI